MAVLFEPESISAEEIDLNFAKSKRTFTGLIKQYYNNPIINDKNPHKKSELILTNGITAELYDEWSEIMHYFWTNPPSTVRDNMHLSITFYGVCVIKKEEEKDKNFSFILDGNTPNSSDIWIELKTCCNRICGQNGIRLNKMDVLKYVNNGRITNQLCPWPHISYLPLSQLLEISNIGSIYGYITKCGHIGTCRGPYNFSLEIQIRDSSLSRDTNDWKVTFYGNIPEDFPNATESDIIRLCGLNIFYGEYGVGILHDSSFHFIVMDGNSNINNKKSVKHSNLANYYHFDGVVDGYFVKYLKEQCRIKQQEKQSVIYLNEIQQKHDRVNLVVMIIGKVDIDNNENDDDEDDDVIMDKMEFYWVIWDGSNCDENKYLFEIHDDSQIIASSVKILVSHEYETAIQCYNDIKIGSFVQLFNILMDHNKKQLVFDKYSKIYSKIEEIKTNSFIEQRIENIYYNIQQNRNIISYDHKFESFTLIKSILNTNEPQCKYRIIGQCVGYHPKNIQKFTQFVAENEYKLQFVLYIKDASQSIICVIFEGKEAEKFLNIDKAQDLTEKNSEQLQEIGHCMERIMNRKNMIDLCLRSFRVKRKQLIGYKAFDSVLIK